ncbi:hypothetical protein ACLEIY_10220 [Acetobacter tropicalis]|uniref:Uncharacterized protein n=1 Tax=Acetobacter senegalensis TaxID=446692 RepID=A0A0U5EV29_9PROT|nr:hypothetical protein [Acetobacter senegalensis]CEF40790.1 hypothetical protein predicted by Glimmer/Critica [Acetobacter senegalensis]CEF41290.1 hypothetical protein predicted by Glimmer/Critica [Acetobacter senegalensis]
MARLSDIKIDSAAIADGVTVPVEQYPGLKITVRGFTDAFRDAQARRLAQAAQKFRNDVSRIPFAVRRQINSGLLSEFLIVNVDGLYSDDAETVPVTLEEFKNLLANPDYRNLADACWDAAALVNTGAAEQVEKAEGN